MLSMTCSIITLEPSPTVQKKYPCPSIGAEIPEFVASRELPVINFLYTGYAVFNEK
jgi:hypothetical protein